MLAIFLPVVADVGVGVHVDVVILSDIKYIRRGRKY